MRENPRQVVRRRYQKTHPREIEEHKRIEVKKAKADPKPPAMSDYHLNLWKDAPDEWVFRGRVVRHLIADVIYWRNLALTHRIQPPSGEPK